MGHTFCAAPASPSSPSKHPRAKTKAKRTPRSSGVPGNWTNWGQLVSERDSRNLKKICEINEEGRYLSTLREVLRSEPPLGIVNSSEEGRKGEGSKRGRKRVIDRVSRTGKMLLSRQSSEQQQPLSVGVVKPRVSSGGTRYAQIAAGGDFYGQGFQEAEGGGGGCANASVYRVNECWEIADGKGDVKDTVNRKEKEKKKRRSALTVTEEKVGEKEGATGAELKKDKQGQLNAPKQHFLAPIETAENNESPYLGITDDYLLPAVDGDENGHNRPDSLLPPPPVLGKDESSHPEDARTNTFPRLVFRSKAPQSQIGSGDASRAPHHRREGSPVKRSSLRIVKRAPAASSGPLSPQVAVPVSIPTSKTPQAYPPQTPRNSSEEVRRDFHTSPKRAVQASPRAKTRARAPSLQSTNGSVVEDGQSEASVGIPMMARSAEVVRPGYLNGEIHKFPKPGPAPTGALPSLPEGHDSRTSIVLLPSVGPAPATPLPSPEASPKRPSPGRRYRYRPLDDVVTEDTTKMLRTQTKSYAKNQSAEPATVERDATPRLNNFPQTISQSGWHEKRAQSRRELKLRDLNRLRSQDGLDNMDEATAGRTPADRAARDQTAAVKDMKESYSSPALLTSSGPSVPPKIVPTATDDQRKPAPRPLRELSPIVVIAEQEPTVNAQPAAASDKPTENGRRSSKRHHYCKDSIVQSAAQPPSFPSSDEESGFRAQRTHVVEHQRRSQAKSSSTHRSSALVQELEARLEGRIAELERKNALLLNAFVAVINTSAGSAPTPLTNGGSLSSSSGRTSSAVSGQRSSGQSGGTDGHSGSISEMHAPLNEISGKVTGKTTKNVDLSNQQGQVNA